MSSYCCFFDPAGDTENKSIHDLCPICNRPYDYPLTNLPAEISHNGTTYTIQKAIARGFYGATYQCLVSSQFKPKTRLVKVIPKIIYDHFNKDFLAECATHSDLAENTEHIVDIHNAFSANVTFGNNTLECHVAELDFVDGISLKNYIEDDTNATPTNFAQVAIDLLRLLGELTSKHSYHNDLHTGNVIIENLKPSIRRLEGLNDRIRLVAIDLNSAKDESLSNVDRKSDQAHISDHIQNMVNILKLKYSDMDSRADIDYRIIETLEKISNHLSTPTHLSNTPDSDELIRMIRDEFANDLSYSPWKRRFSLVRLNDGINAQTIHSCYIPSLLEDTSGEWLSEIAISEPQLITGMRGCGKTMLLNSLDFHARLYGTDPEEASSHKIGRITSDEYVGLLISCRYITKCSIDNIFSLLTWLYIIESIRVARHLMDVSSNHVNKDYPNRIAETIHALYGASIPIDSRASLDSLEKYLVLQTGEFFNEVTELKLSLPPNNAFELLASTFRTISPLFSGKKIFFLLDDASTRHLDADKINTLLQNLLFMQQDCAFKITTELQSIIQFNSAGNVDPASESRDYQIFDLGSKVFEKTSDPNKGKKFIKNILMKRKQLCKTHPPETPEYILGDCTLASIAENIVKSKVNPQAGKEMYHGISALTALCVGDIGDVIFLYDSIVKNSENSFPASRKTQTECFQQLCSRRIYHLSTRRSENNLRQYAKCFAEASHRLLIESQVAIKQEGAKRSTLRQYNGLYVRITSGDTIKQLQIIRELIDAGIFVFADGSGAPRTVGRDADPVLQFKLAFRKLFGLSYNIGLSSADRFELSGEQLEKWLNCPTKEILMENLAKNYSDEIIRKHIDNDDMSSHDKVQQMTIFNNLETEPSHPKEHPEEQKESIDYLKQRARILELNPNEKQHFNCLITSAGFEDRCAHSIGHLIDKFEYDKVILFEYDLKANSEINKVLKEAFPDSHIERMPFGKHKEVIPKIVKLNSFQVDITGMSKPAIFEIVRKSILEGANFSIAYGSANKNHPTDEAIETFTAQANNLHDPEVFTNAMNTLRVGESSPYSILPLLKDKHDNLMRPTVLIAAMSPKNQRLFSLLDENEFDLVNILVPQDNSERSKLARVAAEIAAANYPNIKIETLATSCPNDFLDVLMAKYYNLYNDGYNIELALTGSKIQTLALATFSAVCKTSQCWYVKPDEYDSENYSEGFSEIRFFEVKLQ